MKRIIALTLLSACAQAEIKKFDLSKGQLRIENEMGQIKVKGGGSKKVTVRYKKISWSDKCQLIFEKKENEILIKTKKDSSLSSSNNCHVDFEITVPNKIETNIRNGFGDVSLTELQGDLDFRIGNGNLIVKKSKMKFINGNLGNGNLDLKGEFSNIYLKVGNGSISTNYHKIIKPGVFDLKLGRGNVNLNLSKKMTTNVFFKSGVGQLLNETSYNENPTLKVNVFTGMGDLSIRSSK